MAYAAVLRESGCRMVGIRSSVEVRQMAGDARRRQPCENVILVTGRACHRNMSAGQREFRLRSMVECCSVPISR